MAVGDPQAVFRPHFDPTLTHRRRYTPPPVPPEGSLHGAFQKIRRPPPGLPRPPWSYFAARGVHRHATFQNEIPRSTQVARLTIAAGVPPQRVTQVVRLGIGTNTNPLYLTQSARLIVARSTPCVTKWQQLWRITRKDGVVFRYTSLDVDYTWGSELFKTCGGFMPSAAEDGSQVGAISNQELVGIFKDDGIKEAELYGGLFNDAFVEVWLKSWDANSKEIPQRIAAGWTGNLQHDEGTFNMEVIGPGARLDQQAITTVFAPGCRWVFGSVECGFDREAVKLTATVTAVFARGLFIAELDSASSGMASDGGGAGMQWENGLVRWTSGNNDAVECEVKTADFNFGQVDVELWELPGFNPEVGDTFDLLPGCDLSFTTCKDVYANGINFGGFKDVPGEDSVTETPDAKIS